MKIKIDKNYFDIKPFYPGQTINQAAVYTVWTYDLGSEEYQLLFVGECSESGVILDETNKHYEDWVNCQISSLYLAVNPMPENEHSREERQELKQFLIELYRPICNI